MPTGCRGCISKICCIPQRYIQAFMAFFAIVNAYNMRVCLSVAITTMAKDESINSGGWDSKTRGYILSSFFWGYVVTHVPGGVISEHCGGKHSLGIGMLATVIFTFFTPVVLYYGDWKWFVAVRVIEGLGEGVTYPAINNLLSHWVPLKERAKLGTFVYSGNQIGTIMGNSISGALIHYTGRWEDVFYFFGIVGLAWYFIWLIVGANRPNEHPFIRDAEKEYLYNEIGQYSLPQGELKIPWKDIFTSAPIWALIIAAIGHDWGFFTMITDLPTYMDEILGFDIKSNGFLSSVPYAVMWVCSMFAAWTCDVVINYNVMSITNARKFYTTVASVGPGAFLVLASYAGTDSLVVVAIFCVGMGLMGFYYPGMKVNALDLASNYSGTVMALVNGIGALSGIIVPILIGYLTPSHSIEEWQFVFWISLAVFLFTNIIYIIWGSGEEQPWNKYGINPSKPPPPRSTRRTSFEVV